MTQVRIDNLTHHANELLDLLVDAGPLTMVECLESLNWTRGQFGNALRYARERLCPDLGMAIPAPTPYDGWLYRVTTEWEPVEAGASWTMGLVESRLTAVHRDVRIVLPHLARGSKEWRRANFLNKHLTHILGTLAEIDG